MRHFRSLSGAILAAAAIIGPASAQAPEQSAVIPPPPTPVTGVPGAPLNPDEMADYLNSQQQIRQSFTFTRTVDGAVVETKEESVVYGRNDPIRSTEAGQSALDRLKARFDAELLSKTEAFEEAKMDFVVADLDRDGAMTADEYVGLVNTWRENASVAQEAEARRLRQEEFVEDLSGATPEASFEAEARRKFAFMAGASPTLAREVYLREYLIEFDSADVDHDTVLKGDELARFRALARGRVAS